MNLELKPFAPERFAEYASWFADPDLNRQLGPLDEEWLELTVSGGEEPGDETWAVFRGGEFVAVVEALIDPRDQSYAIASVATKPALRRQGIGSAALRHVLAVHESRGITEHTAQVSVHNQAGQRCAASAGFTPLTGQPNARGYIELRSRAL